MEGRKFWLLLGFCIFLLMSPFIFFSNPAMGCYQGCVDKDPTKPGARKWHLRLAWIYYNSFRPEKAAEAYGKFAARYPVEDPERPNALKMQAKCIHDLGHPAEAIEVWKQLVREYPDHP